MHTLQSDVGGLGQAESTAQGLARAARRRRGEPGSESPEMCPGPAHAEAAVCFYVPGSHSPGRNHFKHPGPLKAVAVESWPCMRA